MPEILPIVVRVIERDLAPSLIVFFGVMVLGQFYVFAAIISYFVLLVGGGLVFAYKMHNQEMIKVCRAALVILTFCGFLNIFVDSMTFTDINNDQLRSFAHPSKAGQP